MSSNPVVPKQATSYDYETCAAAANATDTVFGSTKVANRRWLDNFRDLRRYKVDHGNFNVPPSYGGTQLSAWVDEQRSDYQLMKEGKPSSMTDERVRQLESIGFHWSNDDTFVTVAKGGQTYEEKWNVMFHELEAYKTKHGHCNVPRSSGKLGTWITKQRTQYRLFKEGKSSYTTDERVQKLESIGFQWSAGARGGKPNEEVWNARFHEFEASKAKHGQCNVPAMSFELKSWVLVQRRQYRLYKEGKHSTMTDERIAKLESSGFLADEVKQNSKHFEKMWNARFHELEAYKAKHGHCNLPRSSGTLGRWADTQRSQYRLMKEGLSSRITDERVQKLESIGFQWSLNWGDVLRGDKTLDNRWHTRFHELEAYKAKHGHCNVPTKLGKLGRWVKAQREHYRLSKEGKHSSMTNERVRRLESIGFQWSVYVSSEICPTMQMRITKNDAAAQESVSPMDDGHCRGAVASSNNDDKMDDQSVSYDPPIVTSSQVGNGEESEFHPFLLGTGYC